MQELTLRRIRVACSYLWGRAVAGGIFREVSGGALAPSSVLAPSSDALCS